ncbi:helix-turn-helix domain-containing protein [Viridibacillus arvi]|uniref:helix-turn-helix domain-containing protein n=1 Tax=Viridibacillus arvi TaxID=263475 RepID=UPI0034CE8940
MNARKITSSKRSKKIGITKVNLSILKIGKACAIRFATLKKICQTLNCQTGDILEYEEKTDI